MCNSFRFMNLNWICFMMVSVGWCLLPLMVKILANLRLTVNTFPLFPPGIFLTLNLFLRLMVKICQFLRQAIKCFGRFTANGQPHWDPPILQQFFCKKYYLFGINNFLSIHIDGCWYIQNQLGGGGSKGLGEILPYKFRKSRLVCNGYEWCF